MMRGRGRLAGAALAACGLALAAPAFASAQSPALAPGRAAAGLKSARAMAAWLDREPRPEDSLAQGAAAPFEGLLDRAGLQPSASQSFDDAAPGPPAPAPAFKETLPPLSPEPGLARCKYWIFDCRQASGVTYETISAPLYAPYLGAPRRVSAEDVVQGSLDDCYLMASLAAVAQAHPDLIRRMIRQNADGTFSVTFYKRRLPWEFWKPEYGPVVVRVDNRFPASAGESGSFELMYAQQGPGGIWPMVVEKAYAAYKGSYADINGIMDNGLASSVLEALTGQGSRTFPAGMMEASTLEYWLKAGAAVIVSTKADLSPFLGSFAKALPEAPNGPLYKNGTLVPTHDYWVESVDMKTHTVTLGNPWGWSDSVTLSARQFRDELLLVYVNPIR
ncbi:MAG: hypothetical protein KGI84_04405 [Elusimicrobia bacterium]|nr:hypothetical protein [Elusimicrobiota bacterium]